MHCRLDHIYDISNVNEGYAFFKDKFVSILNTLAPIKEIDATTVDTPLDKN